MIDIDAEELLHIAVSVLTISLAFSMTALKAPSIIPAFFASFPIVLVTVGTGFVLHELAHKAVAQRYGLIAVYRAWGIGLALALGMAIMTLGSFIFAAPGAVYIGGRRLSLKEDGLISAAGPMTNIILGVLFSFVALMPNPVLQVIGSVGAGVNYFLAFFNLIPIPPIDGSKIIQWNIAVWAVMIGLAGFLTFF
jgi:Zn-dependent protease